MLVVGGGPSGLECARALGQRGYSVVLVEARKELGGRVALEANLPGLSEWRRVIDWRLTQIQEMDQVSVYPASPMSAKDVQETAYAHVVIATGALWGRDGVGRTHWRPIPGYDLPAIFTPDDILADRLPMGQVLVYDDDHYYMGGLIAELLSSRGCVVTMVTPAPLVSYWTQYTLEQERIQRRLMAKGVTLFTQHSLTSIQPDRLTLSHTISNFETSLPYDAVVLVGARAPNDELYLALKPALEKKIISTLRVIGDAEAPTIIAQAVFSGYLAATEFDKTSSEGTPFRIEYVEV